MHDFWIVILFMMKQVQRGKSRLKSSYPEPSALHS
jgi:hypothetical protein